MELLIDKNREYRRYRHSVQENVYLAQNGLIHVLSSNVSAVGKSGDNLIIRFHNGSLYEYEGMANRLEDILNSNSKGHWVWVHLRRKKVPYRKIGALRFPTDINKTDKDLFEGIDKQAQQIMQVASEMGLFVPTTFDMQLSGLELYIPKELIGISQLLNTQTTN